MADVVLNLVGVGKKYRLRANGASYNTLRDSLSGLVRLKRPALTEEFWAASDITFSIPRGQAVGVIGRNGAGKSTLLKLISRITSPTTGRIEVTGTISSLLEVGTGFHPELTGRENIFLNAAILGMSRNRVNSRLEEIVAFAEVERFLDTPVKHYSSGMYLRLAFAVAAHLEPDILVVDEVLAVGDASFQRKCLGRMQDVAGTNGRTVLFVSHNMTAVQTLCSRAIWLEAGRVVADGPTRGVVDAYLARQTVTREGFLFETPETAPGNDHVRVKALRLKVQGDAGITVETPFEVEFEYWVSTPGLNLSLSMLVESATGELIFNAGSGVSMHAPGLHRGTVAVPANLMNDGRFAISMLVVKDASAVFFAFKEQLFFDVEDVARPGAWLSKWPGAVRPKLAWTHEVVDVAPEGAP